MAFIYTRLRDLLASWGQITMLTNESSQEKQNWFKQLIRADQKIMAMHQKNQSQLVRSEAYIEKKAKFKSLKTEALIQILVLTTQEIDSLNQREKYTEDELADIFDEFSKIINVCNLEFISEINELLLSYSSAVTKFTLNFSPETLLAYPQIFHSLFQSQISENYFSVHFQNMSLSDISKWLKESIRHYGSPNTQPFDWVAGWLEQSLNSAHKIQLSQLFVESISEHSYLLNRYWNLWIRWTQSNQTPYIQLAVQALSSAIAQQFIHWKESREYWGTQKFEQLMDLLRQISDQSVQSDLLNALFEGAAKVPAVYLLRLLNSEPAVEKRLKKFFTTHPNPYFITNHEYVWQSLSLSSDLILQAHGHAVLACFGNKNNENLALRYLNNQTLWNRKSAAAFFKIFVHYNLLRDAKNTDFQYPNPIYENLLPYMETASVNIRQQIMVFVRNCLKCLKQNQANYFSISQLLLAGLEDSDPYVNYLSAQAIWSYAKLITKKRETLQPVILELLPVLSKKRKEVNKQPPRFEHVMTAAIEALVSHQPEIKRQRLKAEIELRAAQAKLAKTTEMLNETVDRINKKRNDTWRIPGL